MGVENVLREVEVRAVRCDYIHVDELAGTAMLCDKLTTSFTGDVTREEDVVSVTEVGWLQLRGSGSRWRFFCSYAHMQAWVTAPASPLFFPGGVTHEDER